MTEQNRSINLGARGESGSQLNGDNMLMRETLQKIRHLVLDAESRIYRHVSEITPIAEQPKCCLCGRTITEITDAKVKYESVAMNEGFGNGGETWTCRECFAGTGNAKLEGA